MQALTVNGIGFPAAAVTAACEAVKGRISAFLSESAWRSAVTRYIGFLVAGADIGGLDLGYSPQQTVQ